MVSKKLALYYYFYYSQNRTQTIVGSDFPFQRKRVNDDPGIKTEELIAGKMS